MPHKSTVHAVTAIGIDMGKNTLHMIGLDLRGAIVLWEKVSRGRIASRLATCSPEQTSDPSPRDRSLRPGSLLGPSRRRDRSGE